MLGYGWEDSIKVLIQVILLGWTGISTTTFSCAGFMQNFK